MQTTLLDILESLSDDWMSDYTMQQRLAHESGTSAADAYPAFVTLATDWIRRGVVVAGEMTDGFVAWPGDTAELASRFENASRQLSVLALPGDICWFDSGDNATAEATRLRLPS